MFPVQMFLPSTLSWLLLEVWQFLEYILINISFIVIWVVLFYFQPSHAASAKTGLQILLILAESFLNPSDAWKGGF